MKFSQTCNDKERPKSLEWAIFFKKNDLSIQIQIQIQKKNICELSKAYNNNLSH